MPLPTNIPPVRLQRRDEAITEWYHRAPQGTTIEHVLDPDFWAHTAAQMRRTPNKGIGDTVWVVAEDGSFDIEVLVVAVDPRGLWAQVRVLRAWQHEGKTQPAALTGPDKDGYVVEFSGPQRWRILDRSGEIVSKDHPDESAAREALANIKVAKGRKAA